METRKKKRGKIDKKVSMDGLRLDTAERFRELEKSSMEIIQTGEEREKNFRNMTKTSVRCGTHIK